MDEKCLEMPPSVIFYVIYVTPLKTATKGSLQERKLTKQLKETGTDGCLGQKIPPTPFH